MSLDFAFSNVFQNSCFHSNLVPRASPNLPSKSPRNEVVVRTLLVQRLVNLPLCIAGISKSIVCPECNTRTKVISVTVTINLGKDSDIWISIGLDGILRVY